jgi:histidinol dehydrogenase
MRIIQAAEFDGYWEALGSTAFPADVEKTVVAIIDAVRKEGDLALKRYASKFDKSSPERIEVSAGVARRAWAELQSADPELASALTLAAGHIRRFAELQRVQFADFETELESGLFTGQRVIPVERAAVYVPAGRFPLFSSVLMGIIPALAAGVEEIILASPPMEDGLPDRRILAAAALAAHDTADISVSGSGKGTLRIFAMGGAQAIAALALGTESVPKAAVIVGPGNKYVAAAKRALFGEVGIDFIAGPTDVLVMCDENAGAAPQQAADLAAADMLAQAEHDPDARARVLVPSLSLAEKTADALEAQLKELPEESKISVRASLDAEGLIIVYTSREEAVRIANIIAPEHLELHLDNPSEWIPLLKNYGSLFIGRLSAEVLGDYSAGINHTLPTSGSARFTGGLSVRYFLKTVTTLRCEDGSGFEEARRAAEILGLAEGLAAHAKSAAARKDRK